MLVSINGRTLGVLSAMLALPGLASAQIANSPDGGPLEDLMANILIFTNDVLIPFIIGIGFLFFVFGMFRYFILGGANEESKEKGKSQLIWATIGFVLIIIFFGIVNLITQSTGLQGEVLLDVPEVPFGTSF